MYGLINIAYSSKICEKFEKLYIDSDNDDRLLLRRCLAQALKDKPNIIPSHGADWFLCTLAQYSSSSDDVLRVFQSIVKCLCKFQFGIVDEEMQFKSVSDIADTCLVGVGFFRPKMEMMYNHHAAPSVDYYIKAGSLAFIKSGYEDIGNDFVGWTRFIEKELTM